MRSKKLKGSFLGEPLEFSVLSKPSEISEFLRNGAELVLQHFSCNGMSFLSHELWVESRRVVTALDFVDGASPLAMVDLQRASETSFAKWKKGLCVGPFKSEFQKDVLLALLRGTQRPLRLIDYSELSRQAGKASAVRASATVMSSNPWPVIFPCHRVLPKSSLLKSKSAPMSLDVGGYGGSRYSEGASLKKTILEIEGLI